MIKPALSKLLVFACMLFVAYACTTKNEVATPVVDTQRKDALVKELQTLQQQVLQAQQSEGLDSLSLTQLQAQIAALQAQLGMHVNYTVQVMTYTGQIVPGAKVQVSQGGKTVPATTGTDGTANFTNLYSGIISVTVDLTGFARLVYRADIRNGMDNASSYSAFSNVLMMPLGGTALSDAAMVKQPFRLYANYSIVDDTLGISKPVGQSGNNIAWDTVKTQTVTAFLPNYSFGPEWNGNYIPQGFTGFNNQGIRNGEVTEVAYENAMWSASAPDATGLYSIQLPAVGVDNSNTYGWGSYTNNYMDFSLIFSEFSHPYTLYQDGSAPYSINTANPKKPTYSPSYIFKASDSAYAFELTSVTVPYYKFFYSASLN